MRHSPVARFQGFDVLETLPVPVSDDVVLLLDDSRDDLDDQSKRRNLLRVDSKGSVVWQADLPDVRGYTDGADAYVAVAWRKGKLTAYTWSCFFVELNPKSGQILKATFTK
jgi:hypothetical protein